jgi:hypothetical protein
MKLVEETFTKQAFLEMFLKEVTRCVKRCNEESCIGPLPNELLFYRVFNTDEQEWETGLGKVKLPNARLLVKPEKVIDTLLNEKGWYPEWIHISPFAVTPNHLVIEVCPSENITNKRFIESSFPKEPFQLRGPSLPPDWRPNQPIPKVKLPSLEIINA